MGTTEAVLQVLSAGPRIFTSDPCASNLDLKFSFRFHVKSVKKRASKHKHILKCSNFLQHRVGIDGFKLTRNHGLFGNAAADRLQLPSCKCHQAESVSGMTAEDRKETWFVDNGKVLNLNDVVNTPNVLEFSDIQQLKQEKQDVLADGAVKQENGSLSTNGAVKQENGSLSTNGAVGIGRDTPNRVVVNSVEDEAWDVLRGSVVYYCGSPIGTIAANDPTSSDMLNYDQVFIRDFIPSGIAFLLKGEYDIVRNFILHTLQLQSWEKTMDCHSPGQGLMPASFKVRTVPLDGDDSATEEVLDPDFGEAAIGRVAPVDSGLWWIILLRAYGKFSGDLSVQERIDVQTGIKMILRLCLADGFDMFPTLLVTDGSCMIDRRMGIHGHPLEIQKLLRWCPFLCASCLQFD